ncbi:ribonuclease D [Terrarubrum flagellatum]|uniref:ribonuclease D n=1 Tax=Terrirubrum flagellatum TaxID=2895980 RepID=UPI0031451C4E
MNLITTTADLSALCQRLAGYPFVTVDTEFLRETTYYPKLCLIQLAGPAEAAIIDPLAPELDLAPFFGLMREPGVVKVFHAARQDLEIIWNLGRLVPSPLFDSQVAAMVCGYGDSVSYEQLANDFAKARIDKSSRFTDWSRRPLTNQQLHYAESDVTHLRAVYLALKQQVEEHGRADWLADEMAILSAPSTYEMKPEEAWQRLKGRIRKPRELAVLMEVAAWRETEAQTRDVPRSRVLKDDALSDLAVRAPKTLEAMADLRSLPKGFERSRAGAELLEAVKRGLDRDPKSLPMLERPRARNGSGGTVDLLKVLLKVIADQARVAPKIIATVDELDDLASDDNADVACMKGWRRELFGDKALALKHGHVALSLHNGDVVARELAPAAPVS